MLNINKHNQPCAFSSRQSTSFRFFTCVLPVTFCLLLINPGYLKAQVLTLDSILAGIERNHPGLQSYNFQIGALDAYAEGAKSWEAPQAGAGFFMTPYGIKNNENMGSVMFSVQQMIPNPQKLKAKQDYMLGLSSVEKENKNYFKNQLLSQAKTLYYDWVVLKKKQTVLKENEGLLNFIVQSAEIRYPYGKVPLHSIYKAKANLHELQNKQLMLDNKIKQKNIALNTLLNQDKNIIFDVDTSLVIKNYDTTVVDTSTIESARSDIKAMEQSIRLQKLNQAIELSRRKPDFGIRYDHMSTFGNQPELFTVMGMVSIPIAPWASREYKAKINGINFEILALEQQRQAIINETAGQLNALHAALASNKQQLVMYEKSIISALQNNYKTSLIAYEQNTEDLFVVLDALTALQMAQLERLNKLQELLQLQVAYEKELEQR